MYACGEHTDFASKAADIDICYLPLCAQNVVVLFWFFFPLWLDMVIPHLPFSLSMVETSLISFVSLVLQLLFCLGFYPFVLYRKYQLFPCDRIYIIKAASFNSVYCLCENIARISIFCILMVQGFFICLFLLF